MRTAAMVSLVLSGCAVQHTISFSGDTLAAKATTLRTTGRAEIATHEFVDGTAQEPPGPQRVETVSIDQTVTDARGRTRWIRDLLRGCDPDGPAEANVDCELALGGYYDLRSWQTRTVGPIAAAVIGAGIVGGLGTAGICLELCETGSTAYEVSKWSLIGTGTLFVGAVVWAIIDCRGRWGQPGCRD